MRGDDVALETLARVGALDAAGSQRGGVDRVSVVLGQVTVRGKGGQEGSWRFAHVWKLRDGKGVRVEPFIDTLAELRALGGASNA